MSIRSRLGLCLLVLTAISVLHAQQTDSTKATVYVYRQGKFNGKALHPSVFLDDKKVADISNGRYFALRLDPGPHTVRSNEKDSVVDQDFEAGKVYFVAINIVPGFLKGHGLIANVSERQARKEMEKLKVLDKDDVAEDGARVVVLDPLK